MRTLLLTVAASCVIILSPAAQSVPQSVREAMAIAAAIYPELATRQQHTVTTLTFV